MDIKSTAFFVEEKMLKDKKKRFSKESSEAIINKIAKMREEIDTLISVIAQKDAHIQELEKRYTALKEQYEKYMDGYSERVEALAEAEQAHKEAAERMRNLLMEYKAKAEKQIDFMRRFNARHEVI